MNCLLINKKDRQNVFYNNAEGVSQVRVADDKGVDAYYWQVEIVAGTCMDDYATRKTASFKKDDWSLYEEREW